MEVLCQGEFIPGPQNIVLVGFMGCGKSAIGKELANLLSYPLVDTDQVIENEAGRTIPEIFQDEGEPGFRKKETETLAELVKQQPNHQIISTGGGIVVTEENHAYLSQLGFVVWLTARPETVLARVEGSTRPLLATEDPLQTIKDLQAQRHDAYEKASHVAIETDDLTINEIASGVLETARYHFCK